MKIGLIVGSLRKESWNLKVAKEVKNLFRSDVDVSFIDIKDLPFYNPDLDELNPNVYEKVRDEIRKCDGYVFFTPEYNRTFTPVIKNVIDVASLDPKGNPWAKKHALIVSSSPGSFGGISANLALRQAFIFVDLYPLNQPEVYLARINTLFNGDKLDERTLSFLKKSVDTLTKTIENSLGFKS